MSALPLLPTFEQPSIQALRIMLRETTERLASELRAPQSQPPAWTATQWKVARAVVSLHGIASPLGDAVRWRGPDSWEAYLQEQQTQTVLRHERIAKALANIEIAFTAAGIAAIALKGAALHRVGIYRPGERPMGDIDLLVQPDDAAVARRALLSIGYTLSFENARHATFDLGTTHASFGYGEHVDNPVHVELHTRVAESLPVDVVDITADIFGRSLPAGINGYPSLASLMRHLLLHAANNIRARALRLIQLNDIALLASRLSDEDWHAVLEANDSRGAWWAHSPLLLTARYFAESIPDSGIDATAFGCPALLRRAARRQLLADVSWSNLRIRAFPGIEWSKSVAEGLAFVKSRIAPSTEESSTLHYTAAHSHWAPQNPWYEQTQVRRIARWVFHRPPRIQTMFAVRSALEHDR